MTTPAHEAKSALEELDMSCPPTVHQVDELFDRVPYQRLGSSLARSEERLREITRAIKGNEIFLADLIWETAANSSERRLIISKEAEIGTTRRKVLLGVLSIA